MHRQMQSERRRGERFPLSVEDFEETFRQVFNREMTANERIYFGLAGKDDLEEPTPAGEISGS
jgi:hypothetical protein